ncbi:MAG: UbiX family flavin prenyltransferase [Rickettsiales bacterium]|nr:UbiX family flavin prenyltransferase [Rickettsiales bacterium]MCA0254146.1 UbiX family flavin prenyltransferase [Pseudomonadota bacterium]
MNSKYNKKLIIAITGASGAIYGIRMLQMLKELEVETHLIISKSAFLTVKTETDYKLKDIISIADYNYSQEEVGAKISSGSFEIDGMIIVPCSMKTLSAITCGYEENLIIRAAGVIMKERKPLALMVRETPLTAVHLENMHKLAQNGVSICPAVPAFYNRPKSIEDLIIHSNSRILDLFSIDTRQIKRWQGV